MVLVAHSIRELIKVIEIKDTGVYRTKSLGFWYIPLGPGESDKQVMAEQLGGDEWASPSTSWCLTHNADLFQAFEVAGFYPIKE
jgi:hypothetical protein